MCSTQTRLFGFITIKPAPNGMNDQNAKPKASKQELGRVPPGDCKQCGEPFTLTDGEIEFFSSRGLHLPKRCKKCRKKPSGAAQPPVGTETPPSMKNKFFTNNDASRIPMVPWRHV